jgi:hypothetical protein
VLPLCHLHKDCTSTVFALNALGFARRSSDIQYFSIVETVPCYLLAYPLFRNSIRYMKQTQNSTAERLSCYCASASVSRYSNVLFRYEQLKELRRGIKGEQQTCATLSSSKRSLLHTHRICRLTRYRLSIATSSTK